MLQENIPMFIGFVITCISLLKMVFFEDFAAKLYAGTQFFAGAMIMFYFAPISINQTPWYFIVVFLLCVIALILYGASLLKKIKSEYQSTDCEIHRILRG